MFLAAIALALLFAAWLFLEDLHQERVTVAEPTPEPRCREVYRDDGSWWMTVCRGANGNPSASRPPAVAPGAASGLGPWDFASPSGLGILPYLQYRNGPNPMRPLFSPLDD
jgi:hypothetical protein